jgi:hypothetical protein
MNDIDRRRQAFAWRRDLSLTPTRGKNTPQTRGMSRAAAII